ncbi:MAG: DUF5686 family protein [Bacteroidota bacterium]
MPKLLLFFITLCTTTVFAQNTIVKGKVTDAVTGEPITGASIYTNGTTEGTSSNFDGNFTFRTNNTIDSLFISYVGYQTQVYVMKIGEVQTIAIKMVVAERIFKGAVINAKVNKALKIIEKAQDAKNKNNIENLSSYECENFTKIQIAINNVSESTKNMKLMKSVQSIFDTIGSLSEDSVKQVLPIFLSENLSNFYYNKNPNRSKEVIIASRVKGVGVEDGSFLSQLLGSTFQQYNFNDNILPILQKNFISPISKSSFLYYNYKLKSSYYPEEGGNKIYQIEVTPKNPLDLVFTGYIWIEDSTFALRRLSLSITNKANLNFVEKLKITQEYEKTVDGAYIPVKNRVLIDIAELSKNSPGMVAVFSSSSEKIKTNVERSAKFFDYPISVQEDATVKSDEFWDSARHEELTIDEKRALAKIDTLTNVKVIKSYVEVINIIFNGYKKIGKLDFGPYALLYGNNLLEGHRIRLGARTNFAFSKRITISGYGAYGLRDEQWKYKGQIETILSRKHWSTLGASYKKDVEQIGVSDDYYGASNLFTAVSVFAASQLNRAKETKVWGTSEFIRGWNAKIVFLHKEYQFEQIKKFNFAYIESPDDTGQKSSNFTNAAITVGLRWAPKEYYLQNDNERVKQSKPGAFAFSVNFTRGFKGVFGSRFDYNRVTATIEKGLSFGYWGRTDFTLSGTKIFERLPYPLLEVHRGNQSFFYSTSSYNLMNFFEFVTDQSAFFKMEHHFNGALLNRIPLMKKLKWREFVEGRAVMGSIAKRNIDLIPNWDNRSQEVSPIYNQINREPYVEVAYGIENIFKILQVAAVHRLTHLNNPNNPNVRRFAIKFGFSVSF